jgi:hypothetical protein
MATGVADIRLIDPTGAQLVAALRKAHAAANRKVNPHLPRMERDDGFWGRFARDCLREPAGRRRSCKAGPQTPEVIAGWWTDPAGRRHFRVVGRTRHRWEGIRGEGELRGFPPWWHVYPESVLAVRLANGGEAFLACCRCGKVGTPGSLGWMGDTCGPCFDRRADGGRAAGGYGHFPGWAGWQTKVGFSADGTYLLGPAAAKPGVRAAHKLRAVDRRDGAEAVGRGGFGGTTVAAGGPPGGFVYAFEDGTVYRWDGRGPARRLVGRPRLYGRPVMAPDASRAVVLCGEVGFTADLTASHPGYDRADGTRGFTVAKFAPAGDRMFGVSVGGDLHAVNPVTLRDVRVREKAFDGLAQYVFPHDLAVSPDETAVAVVLQAYYPVGHVVRVVPTVPGDRTPPRDLPLPSWHRPGVAAFAPDGKHLVTADPVAGWVGFWKYPSLLPAGFVRAVPEDPTWRGGQVLFSPDGRAVAVLCVGLRHEKGSTVVVWPWPDVVRVAGG